MSALSNNSKYTLVVSVPSPPKYSSLFLMQTQKTKLVGLNIKIEISGKSSSPTVCIKSPIYTQCMRRLYRLTGPCELNTRPSAWPSLLKTSMRFKRPSPALNVSIYGSDLLILHTYGLHLQSQYVSSIGLLPLLRHKAVASMVPGYAMSVYKHNIAFKK